MTSLNKKFNKGQKVRINNYDKDHDGECGYYIGISSGGGFHRVKLENSKFEDEILSFMDNEVEAVTETSSPIYEVYINNDDIAAYVEFNDLDIARSFKELMKAFGLNAKVTQEVK